MLVDAWVSANELHFSFIPPLVFFSFSVDVVVPPLCSIMCTKRGMDEKVFKSNLLLDELEKRKRG